MAIKAKDKKEPETISYGATSLYDKCIIAKLQKWTKNTDLHVYGPNETKRLFQVIADETNDTPIKLPILALNRSGGYKILNTNTNVRSYDGHKINTNEDLSVAITTNIVPIQIDYTLDIYTRYYEEADAYSRDLVFNLINHGAIKVTFNYNGTSYTHMGYIRLEDTVSDNSNISERLIPGQFTRLSLGFNVDDALLWNNVIRNTTTINVEGIDIVVVSGEDDVYTEHIDIKEELEDLENNQED